MSYPENPQTVILKNKYYTRGLTELDVWNYYQSVKPKLLKEVSNRDLMVVLMTDLNKPIIRRKFDKGSYIKLTPENYDNIISGRTLSIHSSMGSYEDFSIIDVDLHESDGFRWAIDATKNVYNYVIDKIPIIQKATIRFTGKTSFHIVCYYGRKLKTDSSKFLLTKFLRESPLSKVYTINEKKAMPGVPNLDLNRNCLRCNYITLHSLSMTGLRCMEVPFNHLLSFTPMEAFIKK